MDQANLTTPQQGVVWILVLAGHWLVLWGLLWVQIPQWLATPATPMVVEWIDLPTQTPKAVSHQDHNQSKTTAHNKAGSPAPVAQKPLPKAVPTNHNPNKQNKTSPKPAQSKPQTASTPPKTTPQIRPANHTAPLLRTDTPKDTPTTPTQSPKPDNQQTTKSSRASDNAKDDSLTPTSHTNTASIEPFNTQDDKKPNPNADKSKNKSQTPTVNDNQDKTDKADKAISQTKDHQGKSDPNNDNRHTASQNNDKQQEQAIGTDHSSQNNRQNNAQNTSQETPSTKGLEQNWASKVRAKLEKSLDYPQEALDKKWGGVATLSISVDSNGVVLAVSIVKSSGKAVLDEEAIATAKKASPLPKPPNELMNGQTSKSFRIPMRFDFKKHQ